MRKAYEFGQGKLVLNIQISIFRTIQQKRVERTNDLGAHPRIGHPKNGIKTVIKYRTTRLIVTYGTQSRTRESKTIYDSPTTDDPHTFWAVGHQLDKSPAFKFSQSVIIIGKQRIKRGRKNGIIHYRRFSTMLPLGRRCGDRQREELELLLAKRAYFTGSREWIVSFRTAIFISHHTVLLEEIREDIRLGTYAT